MDWTDKIRRVKIVFVLTAILVAISSLFVSKTLTDNLKREEHGRMEVWAEAMKSLSKADGNTDLSLVLKVLNENDYIPVILLDRRGNVTDYRNVSLRGVNRADSMRDARQLALNWIAEGHVIRVTIDNVDNSYINVCYDESLILKRLTIFPFVQLAVVVIFVVMAVLALLASKRAEQNRVWAGLSKETAHQLGTPISSLMAWVEVLKEEYPDDTLIPELDKDVSRLRLISDRFSKIGSKPELAIVSLQEVLAHVVDYIDRRTSHNVVIRCQLPDHDVMVNINAALFEWVIENLCKNAVDAMNGDPGTISIAVMEIGQKVAIDVADTGKGISKKNLKTVFKPGFTTKKRGWGLGLSLAKRIIEEYHKGRIFVKSSEVGVGTTFRIELGKIN